MVSGDGLQAFFSKTFIKSSLAQGEFPFWSKYTTNGAPFALDLSNNAFYPFALLSFLPFKWFMYSFFAIHLAIGTFFMYLFTKEIGCGKVASLCTALIYEFSIHLGGYRKEHIIIIVSVIYLPAILFFIQKYISTTKIKWLLFSSAAMALQIYGASIQHAIYTAIVAFIYLIFVGGIHYRIKLKRIITDGLLWGFSYLGLIALQLVPALQLTREYGKAGSTAASIEYFKGYSIHFVKLLMMLFPRIYGENVYEPFGAIYSSGFDIELFLGVFVLLIILFGVTRYFSDFWVKLSLGMMVGTFLFSANAHVPLLSAFLYQIPIISGFRVPSRALFIFIFFAFVLFAVTLSKLRVPQQSESLFRFSKWFTLGICAILCCAIFANVLFLMSMQNYEGIHVFYQFCKTALFSELLVVFAVFFIALFLRKGSRRWADAQYKMVYRCLGAFIVLITFTEINSFSLVSRSISLENFDSKDMASQVIVQNIGNHKVWDAFPGIDGGHESIISQNSNVLKGIPAINAFIAFNNPRVYKLFSQETQAPLNFSGLLTGSPNAKDNLLLQNDLLSMLGVKYIIDSSNLIGEKGEIKRITGEKAVVYEKDIISIPDSKGDTFVASQSVVIKPETYYKVEFDMQSAKKQQLFYVDLYGGENYDRTEQDKFFQIEPGTSHHTGYIFSGDPATFDNINLRIVSIPTSEMKITNFVFTEMETQTQNHVYKPFLIDDHIYENINAKDIIYAPLKTETIKDMNDIYVNIHNYDLSNVSYVENFKNMDLTNANTNISVKEAKNNRIKAIVHSDKPSFINFSQNYYPGWKAKVNGKETPVHMVNGLIQGIEVPIGESEIEFYFFPKTLFIGGFITLFTLIVMTWKIWREYQKNRREDG